MERFNLNRDRHAQFLVLFAAVICVSLASATGAQPRVETKKKAAAAEALFGGTTVPKIQIEIPEEGIAKLKKYQWQFGQQAERESVRAKVREGEKVFANVALHLKGAAGSFRPVTENPAMTLHFDKYVEGQRFHGLSKLSLNNSVQDPTLVSEQFSRELFLKAGIPAPRATHATVSLNGRDLGVYVLVEGFDKQFLKKHFKNAKGNLYDGGFLKEVTDELSVNSGDDPKNQSDRMALAEAAKDSNRTNRMARLKKILDLEKFLTFIAVDVMLWDWDGYAMNKNNWRLFHNLESDRMIFLPHGLDQLFWKPEGSIFPKFEGLVAKAVLDVPEWRHRYFERMKELRASVFKIDEMTNRVREISTKVAPLIKERDAGVATAHEKAVADFCESIARRCQSLDRQLSAPIEPLKFVEGAAVPLTRWETKSDFGHPTISKAQIPNGPETLHLGTTQGSSIGSWRTSLWLEKGRYRVDGRVKARGIVADLGDSRGGVGIRLSSGRPEHYRLSDLEWTPIAQEFSVNDPLSEVQVLCEFRGAEGEAWFDLGSLRLTRLDAAH